MIGATRGRNKVTEQPGRRGLGGGKMKKCMASFLMTFLGALLIFFFAFGCNPQKDGQSTDRSVRAVGSVEGSVDTHTLAAGLGDLAPEGWKLYDEVRRFTARNLYEKINGRAEFYLAYDMVEMIFADFENAGDTSQFVDVSIFDMGTPTHAFGVYSAERSEAGHSLELGQDAYRSGANYYIWKGRHYLQIIASDATEELRRIGMDLARGATDLVPDSGELVWGLNALPKEGRVPGSERFFLVDAMGLDFMRNTYMARYRRGGIIVSAFLSQYGSLDEAGKIIARYLEHANRYAKNVESINSEGLDLTSCRMNGSYDVFFQKGRIVAGVSEVADKKTAIQASVDLWKKLPDQ